MSSLPFLLPHAPQRTDLNADPAAAASANRAPRASLIEVVEPEISSLAVNPGPRSHRLRLRSLRAGHGATFSFATTHLRTRSNRCAGVSSPCHFAGPHSSLI